MVNTLKPGMSTLPWYYDEDLLPSLPLLPEAGIHHLELRRLEPHVSIDRPDDVRDFRVLCEDIGLRLHSVHMPIELIHGMSELDTAPRAASVARAKVVAEHVRELGARILVTHAGGRIPPGTARREVGRASLESLTVLGEFCATLGLPLALENTLPVEYGSLAEAMALHDRLASDGVGCCLDTSHANLTGRPHDAVLALGKRLLTLHVSDNDGNQDQHALPFDGTVDWPAFMSALRRVDYDGVLMMEVRGTTDYRRTVREIADRFDRLLDCASDPNTKELSGG